VGEAPCASRSWHAWQSQAELRRSHPTSPCGLRRGHLSPFLPVLSRGEEWRRRGPITSLFWCFSALQPRTSHEPLLRSPRLRFAWFVHGQPATIHSAGAERCVAPLQLFLRCRDNVFLPEAELVLQYPQGPGGPEVVHAGFVSASFELAATRRVPAVKIKCPP